jgi:hypothetical protein
MLWSRGINQLVLRYALTFPVNCLWATSHQEIDHLARRRDGGTGSDLIEMSSELHVV